MYELAEEPPARRYEAKRRPHGTRARVGLRRAVVAQDARRVELFRRSTNWQAEVHEAGSAFAVHGASIAVDPIYDE